MDPDGREIDPYSIYNGATTALKYELETAAVDSSIPAPSDISLPKWIGYVCVIGGTALIAGGAGLVYNLTKDDDVKVTLPSGYSRATNGVIRGPYGTVATPGAAWKEYNGLSDSTKAELSTYVKNARQSAVRKAWTQEQQLLINGFEGTRKWTKSERQELIKTGKVKGYQGHHINSVQWCLDNDRADLIGDYCIYEGWRTLADRA